MIQVDRIIVRSRVSHCCNLSFPHLAHLVHHNNFYRCTPPSESPSTTLQLHHPARQWHHCASMLACLICLLATAEPTLCHTTNLFGITAFPSLTFLSKHALLTSFKPLTPLLSLIQPQFHVDAIVHILSTHSPSLSRPSFPMQSLDIAHV